MAFYTKSTSVWAGQNLYLAQSPIFERAQKGQGGSPPVPPPLAALAEHIDRWVDSIGAQLDFYGVSEEYGARIKGLPYSFPYAHILSIPIISPTALVNPEDVVTINLWMGGKPTATTLHYDSNHNLLVVLRGAKQVQLFPPSATPALEAGRIYTQSANHSCLTVPAEPDDLFTAPRIEKAPDLPWVARLAAGDVLFLPEGWWHQVDSAAHTVALNYWWAGFVETVLEAGGEEEEGDADHMLQFYLRATLQRAVEKERGRMLAEARSKALAGPCPCPCVGVSYVCK